MSQKPSPAKMLLKQTTYLVLKAKTPSYFGEMAEALDDLVKYSFLEIPRRLRPDTITLIVGRRTKLFTFGKLRTVVPSELKILVYCIGWRKREVTFNL